jgi:hypothetical protein
MIGAITVLLGSASIVLLIRILFVGRKRLRSDAEMRLWKKWLRVCIFALILLLLLPGVLEIIGVVPDGTLSCAGAILCFLIIVRSGDWYRQRLFRLRAQHELDVNRPQLRLFPDSRTTHLNGS